MTLFSLIIALLIEQVRPLPVQRVVVDPLSRLSGLLTERFNDGQARHGRVAWWLIVLTATLASALVFFALWHVHPILAFAFNIAVLYVTMGFRHESHFFTDIHRYMRFLEEAVIGTLREFGVESGRIPGLTGVWIDPDDPERARKICALGVKTSRWVTMHGFAFNVNTDLRYFDYIVPCGIGDKAVTSMEKELGRVQPIREVEQILKVKLGEQFGFEWI